MRDTMVDEMTNLLIELISIKTGMPLTSLQGDVAFEDLDLDSLVLLELAVVLQSRVGVILTDLEMVDAGTISATAEIVAQRRSQALMTLR
jgi:acyl carrier protein